MIASVIHNDNLELRGIPLLGQGSQALLKRCPIVVNRYDYAEERDCGT
jgi:hypothetical protein